MKRSTPTIMALTIIVSAGLALSFVKLNIIQTGAGRSDYTAVLVGALIGGAFFLVLRTIFPAVLEKGPLVLRQNLPIVLIGVFAAVAVAAIGTLAELWSRPFLTALGWALVIGVVFGIVYWFVARFAVANK